MIRPARNKNASVFPSDPAMGWLFLNFFSVGWKSGGVAMKTRYKWPALTLVALIAMTSGCSSPSIRGSGKSATETRSVSGFDSVELDGVGRLNLNQSGTE